MFIRIRTEKVMIRIIAVAATAFLATQALAASLVTSRDWQSPGDGLLTYDAATNTEWLDLYLTSTSSFELVQTYISPGGIYEGFRVASVEEVWELMTNFGLLLGAPGEEVTFSGSQAQAVGDFFDIAWQFNSNLGDAMTSDILSSTLPIPLGVGWGFDPIENTAIIGTCCGWAVTDQSSLLSTWLLRDAAPIPVPGAAILFGSALFVLQGLFRRRNN